MLKEPFTFWVNHRQFMLCEASFTEGYFFSDVDRDHESCLFETPMEAQQEAMKYAKRLDAEDSRNYDRPMMPQLGMIGRDL